MKVYKDFDLTEYNSYRIKAKCAEAYFPESEEDVCNFFREHRDYIMLGTGHNVIFSRAYYERPFVIFNGNFSAASVTDGLIEAESGITMLDLSEIALEHGLSGLEIFYDIPSSLGGAVVMNAGASGEEIKDVLQKVRYLDLEDFKVKEVRNEDIDFEYRNSFFQRNIDKVILKAWLKLTPQNAIMVKRKMEEIKQKRWAKQPREFPNAGSVFKRPPGHFVGALIQELGLKGYTVGGAKISEKHGGFIVNTGGATGEDVLQIIREAKDRVMKAHSVNLEVEQRII